jgi:uroporphyrinogen decarboxylase
MAALHGQPVDRVPVSFWAHNFARENAPAELSDETLRLAATFDWDFLKPQVRAQAFAEMWGLTYEPSHERAVSFTTTHVPLQSAADFRGLQATDPRCGALGEQLAALDAIRAGVGADTPIIWTIFAPLMVARYLVPDQGGAFLRMVHTEPAALERGLAAITETLAEYARACLEHGADGLFYATNLATSDKLSPDECRRFQRAFDLPILDVVRAAPFNMLHICGSQVLFDEFTDYPVECFNWSLEATNPTLSEGHRRTGKAVVGGVPAKPRLKTMTPAEVVERAEAAIQDTQGRWYLMSADCSINPDTPDELLFAARQVAYRGGPN